MLLTGRRYGRCFIVMTNRDVTWIAPPEINISLSYPSKEFTRSPFFEVPKNRYSLQGMAFFSPWTSFPNPPSPQWSSPPLFVSLNQALLQDHPTFCSRSAAGALSTAQRDKLGRCLLEELLKLVFVFLKLVFVFLKLVFVLFEVGFGFF